MPACVLDGALRVTLPLCLAVVFRCVDDVSRPLPYRVAERVRLLWQSARASGELRRPDQGRFRGKERPVDSSRNRREPSPF
jgi:hypothetical protein